MNSKYDKYINQWNNIFSKEIPKVPTNQRSGNRALDKGIEWICNGTKSILDFGCGNGTMLFLCALNGTKYNIGVDLSEKAIENAQIRAKQMSKGEYRFIQGSIDALESISDSSFDAIILFNIIDNLYPEDAEVLIKEVERILCSNGKLLVKLNPYITLDQIIEWDLKVIKDNLLDDGLILLNNTTEKWKNFFSIKFNICKYNEIYYPEFEQTNRMFWLTKK
ncbi:Hypothetical protein CM240_2722 [Clostridium bornimense]|uniref:Methyltransferase domain-containing protein n=1 Tax=Clostridium bornimense TaxID=1216932 RepID=W6S1S5_9CLOT|nr:class I SAM-dependent methyltransferase [Clostridium bornimense]CDM69839.1 Hypothetical protein CM240_2722 [Clostridium bornimense]